VTNVAAHRLEMMLTAGKHRLEEKRARDQEHARITRAEKVLEEYRQVHGPLTHKSPPGILELARMVAHDRSKLQLRSPNQPRFARWQRRG
jgi:hypothetical protein